jgi:putative methylase
VIELGCGTGPFCIAASILGAYCICVDIDREALKVAKKFSANYNLLIDFVEADVKFFEGKFDVVFQNPPFGVVRRGADLEFLEKALSISNIIYSIHKHNPKSQELIKKLANSMGFSYELITTNYKLKVYYPWHRKKYHYFLVDIYYFKKNT